MTANQIPRRAAQVLREQGVAALWFKTWGEICYRRVYLVVASHEAPAPAVPDVPVRTSWLEPAEAEEYLRFRPQEDPGLVQRRLRAGRRCFVGRCEGAIVYAAWVAVNQAWIDYLHIGVRLPAGCAYTYGLWVKPAFRDKGLGTRLAWEKNQAVGAMGYPTMLAVIMPENRAALRVNVGAGYRRIGMLRTVFFGAWRRSFLSLRPGAPALSIAANPDAAERV